MINITKQYSIDTCNKHSPDFLYLLRHLPQVEKWANKLLESNPKANREVVLLGVWLHDIGQIIGDKETDHAINSEIETKRFLTELKADAELIGQVSHCVRAHRCKDVQPQTLEAKILAAVDSASHMTDTVYIDMIRYEDEGLDKSKAKLERDYRDVGLFPKLKEELNPIYLAWKKLLNVWPL